MSSVTVCGRHSPDFSFQMPIQFSSTRFTIFVPCFSAYCIVRYAPPLLCWIQHTTYHKVCSVKRKEIRRFFGVALLLRYIKKISNRQLFLK
ncbi:hypothetical protein RUMCAL_01368 [Ruminococcus callidus ATCC 27760]|uniref:Uncharacterized protein n=1 Tax=Ruminococcus callidus ATCC 27760 TaxID=411473 RepID=U2MA88_9FIRM|nr:hypothetical protein RUMCAL_01368 [Ruminococcus callidus ATCC 27760]